jgi:hypothetical protein
VAVFLEAPCASRTQYLDRLDLLCSMIFIENFNGLGMGMGAKCSSIILAKSTRRLYVNKQLKHQNKTGPSTCLV